MAFESEQTSAEGSRQTTYERLVDAIAGGAVLVVGAGSSCQVGYPTWNGLLAYLEAESRRKDQRSTDAVTKSNGLVRARAYKQVLGKTLYAELMVNAMARREPPHSSGHESLVAMPFQLILTTNYDDVLQTAHQSVYGKEPITVDGHEYQKLASILQGGFNYQDRKTIVHLHGSIRDPDNIVLCADDYANRYVRENQFALILSILVATKRFVFVGFSLDDEEFRRILQRMKVLVDTGTPRHFVLLPESPDGSGCGKDEIDLIEMYGVEAVFFEKNGSDYSGLWNLISEMRIDVDRALAERSPKMADTLTKIFTDVLDGDPVLRQRAIQIPGLIHKYQVGIRQVVTNAGGMTAIDAEIDSIFTYVARGLPSYAIDEYERLRRENAGRLSARQVYRIDANIGNALYSQGKHDAAAKAYLQATTVYNDSVEARGIKLLGLYLDGDLERTKNYALELHRTSPEYPRAWAIWIRCHRDVLDFSTIEAQVPRALRGDPEIALALSDLASRSGLAEERLRYARNVVKKLPDWADGQVALAEAILSRYCNGDEPSSRFDLKPADDELLGEAHDAISKAIVNIGTHDPAARVGGLYYNRSIVERLRGRTEACQSDLRQAFRIAPDNPIIVIGFAMEAESTRDVDDALKATQAIDGDGWTVQRQMAEVRLRICRRADGDLDEAERVVNQLCARIPRLTSSGQCADVVRLAIRVLYERGCASDGPALLDTLPLNMLSAGELAALRGAAFLNAGMLEEAKQEVIQAVAQVGTLSSWHSRREVAILASDCGFHSAAFQIWNGLLSHTDTGPDTVHWARAAYAAGEERAVLSICERARVAGKGTRAHLQLEVQVFAECREGPKAVVLLEDWIARNPSDKLAVLQLSVLALREGMHERAVFDELRLPRMDEVRAASTGALLVSVLRLGPNAKRALDLAYELYRRFPDEKDAHGALFACVLDPAANRSQISHPQKVGEAVAVCVRRERETPQWIFVENGANPTHLRAEYPQSHPLVQAMWGLASGARFVYLGHEYQIVAIVDRVVRRVRELLEHHEQLFPHDPVVRRFETPSAPKPEAAVEERLGELYPALQQREQEQLQLQALYRETQLPIATFALMMGRSVFESVQYLASDSRLGVKTADGDPRAWSDALAAASTASAVVVDGTVFSSAVVLNVLEMLPALSLSLIVPQAVVAELRNVLATLEQSQGESAWIGLHAGQLVVTQRSPEVVATERVRIERVLQFIRERCEVVGGEATLDLPRDVRAELQHHLEPTSLDAVALACKRGVPLWTDDLGLRQLLAESGVAVRAVWTQAVFRSAVDAAKVSDVDYVRLLAALLEHGYSFTALSAPEVVAVLRLSEWVTVRGAGAVVSRMIAESAVQNDINRFVAALCFKLLWAECPDRAKAKAIIVCVLNRLGYEVGKTLLARFIYRFRVERRLVADRRSYVVNAVGSVAPGPPIPIRVSFDPFNDRDGRSLKHFLRSWRGRSGEFRPIRVRRRR